MRRYLPIYVTAILTLLLAGAQTASAAIGTGTLYVYYDSGYTDPVNRNEHGQFEVLPGDTVYIQIAGITEFEEGDEIIVKICWDHTKTIPATVKNLTSGAGFNLTGVGDADSPIPWIVGNFDDGNYSIPYCETMTVHYTRKPGPDYLTTPPEYDAKGQMSTVAHLHSVPENPVGTLGTLLVVLATLGVFMAKGRKIPIHIR